MANGGTGLFGAAVFAVPRRLLGLKMWSMTRLPGKAKELSLHSIKKEVRRGEAESPTQGLRSARTQHGCRFVCLGRKAEATAGCICALSWQVKRAAGLRALARRECKAPEAIRMLW
eukprot:scaffold3740_cov108-Isochrysis_galbana.AAC.1